MRFPILVAAAALAASYALPAVAEGDCSWSSGKTTTASDTSTPATMVVADSGKQSKPAGPPKN